MLETLKAIILDSQESKPETGVPRRLHMKAVKNKAAVCIGVRRAGKSTYLYQVMDTLLKNGVPKENILYLNFFDDRLHELRGDGAGLV